MEFGFTVTALTNDWVVGQNYGNPAPFIYFVAQPNQMLTETIAVTEGSGKFRFNSIDLYSSITTNPVHLHRFSRPVTRSSRRLARSPTRLGISRR